LRRVQEEMRIAVFGDSIAWGAWDKDGGGWVDRLKRHMLEPQGYEFVYNFGDTGSDTKRILRHVDTDSKIALAKKYKENNMIIFSVGKNDAIYFTDTKKMNIPLRQFETNLRKMINIARQYVDKIAFTGLLDVDETNQKNFSENVSYQNKNFSKYDKMIQRVCKEEKIHFIPLFGKISYDLRWDGLHPKPEGHKKIFEIVLSYLKKEKLL
jgi:lysophospholipase L1-like esterase